MADPEVLKNSNEPTNDSNMGQKQPMRNIVIDKLLNAQILAMKAKGDDRTDQARYWAIAITDLEKLIAFIQTYIK